MKGYILDVDYIENEGAACIRAFLSENGKWEMAKIDNALPYFVVLPKGRAMSAKIVIDQKLKSSKEISYEKADIASMKINGEQKEIIKIYCKLPTDIPKARDIVKHNMKNYVEEAYEYTINFYRRFLIDNNLDGAGKIEIENGIIKKLKDDEPKFKVLSFDIESYEEAGKQKIIMISIATKDKRRVLAYRKANFKNISILKDEKEMLEEFVKIIKEEDPDIVLTYNGDEYDFDIISQRAKELNVKLDIGRDGSTLKFERRAQFSAAKIRGRVHVDLYSFIANTISRELQTETLSLDSVASEILGDKKIEMEYEEILETWREERDLGRLAEYSEKDVDLTMKLGGALLPQIYMLSNVIGQTIFDTSRMHYGQMAEWYLARRAVQEQMVIPNPPTWTDIGNRRETGSYVGGYVKEPIAGVHENIAVLDFRSLYPSIIATFNISPETFGHKKCKDFHEVPEVKHRFCKEKKGFVSSVIGDLIEKRADLKNKIKTAAAGERSIILNKIQAFKVTANAMYGMFGFTGAKWYCKECAESAAAIGRFYIKDVIQKAEKEGFIVIYSDTDSIFIKIENARNIDDVAQKFLEKINKSLPGMLELDLQGIYKRGIFIPKGVGGGTAKKRYALIDKNGGLTIRGLERVRKDWSNVAKETQESVLRFVLDKNDIESAVDYTRKVINNVRAMKVDIKDFIIYERLTKPLSEYKQRGPHVIAAQKTKDRGRPIGEGMTIMYVITKGTGSISERSEPFEDAKPSEIDTDYYITNQILPSALRVLQVLGVNEEKLLGTGLEKFLSKKKRNKK